LALTDELGEPAFDFALGRGTISWQPNLDKAGDVDVPKAKSAQKEGFSEDIR
jgi:hypothetical protein